MNTRVEFTSTAFPKYVNEDEETVNPNRWGKRLAEFVRDHLPDYGVQTDVILCEDWGWLVFIKHPEFPVWIGCGPLDDFENEEIDTDAAGAMTQGDAASATRFCLFVTAEPGFFRQLFKRFDTTSAVAEVVTALDKMVSDRNEFQEIVWSD